MTKNYDVVIVGGGVNGLAVAYNLARRGDLRVAVVERGYLGSGASGRNGEMVRSAFASEAWIGFFHYSLQLWEQLAAELDFNVMFTRRGYLVLASTAAELERCRANVATQHRLGLRTQLLDVGDVLRLAPALNPEMVAGGVYQAEGGFARHDATVWAYANAARRLGVEIHPFTEVEAIEVAGGRVRGVRTSAGAWAAEVVVNAAGGHADQVAAMAGVELPLKTYRLEMLVTEPLKPFLRPALASLRTMSYMHQTTRGEFAAGAEVEDLPPCRSLRSSLAATIDMARKFVALFPGLATARLMRQWGGLVSMAADVAPILGPAPGVEGLVLNCGWVYGFMGAPAAGKLLADYIVSGQVPPLMRPFGLERFAAGKLVRDGSLVVAGEEN